MTEWVRWEDVKKKRPRSPEQEEAGRRAIQNLITGYELAQLRKSRKLTQVQVAKVMGVSQRRVSAIERGEIDRSEITTLRAYINALGGQIRIVADFGDESTQIA